MKGLLAAIGLVLAAAACSDTGVRRGSAADVRRVSELQPGKTTLNGASAILGDPPSSVTPTESGGVVAKWVAFTELVNWDPPLRMGQIYIKAQFDSAQMLVAVTAGDFGAEPDWFFPDFETFERELAADNLERQDRGD